MFHHKKRRWPWVVLTVLLLLAGFAFVILRWIQTVSPVQVVENERIQNTIVDKIGEEHRETVQLLPTLLGFERPVTYLILFQNSTEIRPGGGFIGSYATIRFDKGAMDIVRLEGSEVLDWNAPPDWHVEPPEQMKRPLAISGWFFRDSNWNIDNARNAQRALEFYTAEGGVLAEEIDAVIAVNSIILEDLLRITGPVTVQGVTFTAENVIETLQYEVEFAYKEKNIAVPDRKQIMKPLFQEILKKTGEKIFFSPEIFSDLAKTIVEEKHVMAYSEDSELNKLIQQYGAEGSVVKTDGDYVQWVDANLAALKTDQVMERSLEYSIQKNNSGRYLARAAMTYKHTGTPDWRTSRYRSFARVYVPVSSTLQQAYTINASGGKQSIALGQVDEAVESEKQSFGYLLTVEPQQTRTLVFEYELPERITANIAVGNYDLDIQKQSGIIELPVSLSLDFDKKVQVATPAEEREFWGDDTYTVETTIRKDEWFSVGF